MFNLNLMLTAPRFQNYDTFLLGNTESKGYGQFKPGFPKVDHNRNLGDLRTVKGPQGAMRS